MLWSNCEQHHSVITICRKVTKCDKKVSVVFRRGRYFLAKQCKQFYIPLETLTSLPGCILRIANIQRCTCGSISSVQFYQLSFVQRCRHFSISCQRDEWLPGLKDSAGWMTPQSEWLPSHWSLRVEWLPWGESDSPRNACLDTAYCMSFSWLLVSVRLSCAVYGCYSGK